MLRRFLQCKHIALDFGRQISVNATLSLLQLQGQRILLLRRLKQLPFRLQFSLVLTADHLLYLGEKVSLLPQGRFFLLTEILAY